MMVFFLASCKESPVSGYVVGKSFIPAHTITYYNVVLKMPQTKWNPDEWFVWIADSCGVHSVRVDKSTFDRLNHGQFVTQGNNQWQGK